MDNEMFNRGEKEVVILLVEDNPGDADLAREAFLNGEMEVDFHTVRDGEAAIRFLEQRDKYVAKPTPDMIILDLNLPRLNGLEVLERIKVDEDFKQIPVVILSSSASEDDIRQSYGLHANCYIRKPFDYQNYENVVRSIEDFWMRTALLPPRDVEQ